MPLDPVGPRHFFKPLPQFGIDGVPCPSNLFVRRNVGSRFVGIRDEGDVKLGMKPFSNRQERKHRVVYGREMSPQVKRPVPARRYLPQNLAGRKASRARPRDQFGCSTFSARERRKSLRFPCVPLLSTTPFHLYFGKVFLNMGAPLFDCCSVASS